MKDILDSLELYRKMFPVYFLFLLLGTIGGMIKYLHIISTDRRNFSFAVLFMNGFISGFIGLMTGVAALSYTTDLNVLLFTAGTSGALGWKSIEIFQNFLNVKLKKVFTDE